jgi:hypothetical protein
MPLPIHDTLASTVNIARAWLHELDLRAENVTVRGPTLDLLLREFVNLAEPRPVQEARDKQSRSVRELVAQVETAERNRDDDQRQSDGRPQQPRRAWG